jgi:hypothetical protein
MTMRVHRAASTLIRFARDLGCHVDEQHAQTGTIYLTITRACAAGLRETRIRVADHQDAYARAAYSCDGIEGSLAGARKHLFAALGTRETVLRRLRRLRRSIASKRTLSEREQWIAGYMRERGVERATAEQECPIRG